MIRSKSLITSPMHSSLLNRSESRVIVKESRDEFRWLKSRGEFQEDLRRGFQELGVVILGSAVFLIQPPCQCDHQLPRYLFLSSILKACLRKKAKNRLSSISVLTHFCNEWRGFQLADLHDAKSIAKLATSRFLRSPSPQPSHSGRNVLEHSLTTSKCRGCRLLRCASVRQS